MSADLRSFIPKKILICQLKQIGDVLLMTPLAELLARHYPGAAIHVFTEKKCLPMLENNPYIARVWPVDKKALPTLGHELAYYRKVARQGFDLVIDLQQTPRCRWVVGFSRARVRLSREAPWYTRWLYTHRIPVASGYPSAMKAALLQPLGITWHGERPRLFLTEDEQAAADGILAGLGLHPEHTLVTVDPTHRRPTRRWPAASYARLLDLAAERIPALRFLLLYGPGEEEEARALAAACRHPETLLLPDRVISLRETAACIKRAVLHLGNCSAPRHMAVAVGTPTLTILGATSTGWTYPSPEHGTIAQGLDCQPCNRNTCNDRHCRCLTDLTPEAVLPELLARLPALS